VRGAGADEVVVAQRRQREGSNDGGAGLVVAASMICLVSGAARQWLSVWWPLTACGVAVLVVLLVWWLVMLRSRRRAHAARQATQDRYVASTDGMSGTDFEHLVARLLRRDGWRQVVVSDGAGDLGADVTARHPHDGTLLVVQCKRYSNRAVSSPDLQRFLGTVFHHHHADHAVYVTTSYYSRLALELAGSSGVRTVDRQQLAVWMAGTPLALATTTITRQGG
jgi:restriction system protein